MTLLRTRQGLQSLMALTRASGKPSRASAGHRFATLRALQLACWPPVQRISELYSPATNDDSCKRLRRLRRCGSGPPALPSTRASSDADALAFIKLPDRKS